MREEKYFFEAIGLAQSVKGKTSPNPAVGCVIVRQGRVVGYGATQAVGKDHAEIVALKMAGKKARGAQMYVTLEPCVSYTGKRTPSCSEAIVSAGIEEITIGMTDPNPKVNGEGIRQLKNAKIKVHLLGEYYPQLESLNEDFFKYIQTGIPYVYAKFAMTLDGNIADENGESKWISSEESRQWVHRLRNRVDAIMVGVGTVNRDDPKLNVRLEERVKDPLRIIIDPRGEILPHSQVMTDGGRTLFIIEDGFASERIALCRENNKDVLSLNPNPHTQKLSYTEIFEVLGRQYGIESVLIEGGGRVLYHALAESQIDKIYAFIAPKILGGDGIPPFWGKSYRTMHNPINLKRVYVENISNDILIQGYLK